MVCRRWSRSPLREPFYGSGGGRRVIQLMLQIKIDQEKIEGHPPGSIIFLRGKLITFEAWLFTQRRIWLYGSGSVVAYVIGLAARLFQHRWLFQEDGTQSCIDFTHYWVSG